MSKATSLQLSDVTPDLDAVGRNMHFYPFLVRNICKNGLKVGIIVIQQKKAGMNLPKKNWLVWMEPKGGDLRLKM